MILMRWYSWSCDAAPLPTAETMMGQSDDILDTPQLDYEAWRDLLRAMCGRYNPEGIEPNAFTGWVRPVSVCGFTALAARDAGFPSWIRPPGRYLQARRNDRRASALRTYS